MNLGSNFKNDWKFSKSACKKVQLFCECEMVAVSLSPMLRQGKINDFKLVDKLLSGSYTIFRSLTLFIEKAPTGECVWMRDRLMYVAFKVMGDRTRLGEKVKYRWWRRKRRASQISLWSVRTFSLAGEKKRERLPHKKTTPHNSNHEKPIKNLINGKKKHFELHNNRL